MTKLVNKYKYNTIIKFGGGGFMAASLYEKGKAPLSFNEYVAKYEAKFRNNLAYKDTVGECGSPESKKNFLTNWSNYKKLVEQEGYTKNNDGTWAKKGVSAKNPVDWNVRALEIFGSNDLNGDGKVDAEDARWLQNEYANNKDKWTTAGYQALNNGNYTVDGKAGSTTLNLFNWYSKNKDKLNAVTSSVTTVEETPQIAVTTERSLYYDLNRSRLTNNYMDRNWTRVNASNFNRALSTEFDPNKWKINSQGQDTDLISAIRNMYGDSYRGRRFEKRLIAGNLKAKDLRRLGKQEAQYQRNKNLGIDKSNLQADPAVVTSPNNAESIATPAASNTASASTLYSNPSLLNGSMNGFGRINFGIAPLTFKPTSVANIPVDNTTISDKDKNEQVGVWER